MCFRVLVDPQVLQDGVSPLVLNSIAALQGKLGLRAVPIGLEDSWRVLGEYRQRTSRPQQETIKLILCLARQPDEVARPADIEGEPLPELPAPWRAALCECVAADCWRQPAIVTSVQHRGSWPAGNDVRVAGAEPDDRRVLVAVEDAGHHPFFRRHYDPWLLKSVEPRQEADLADIASRHMYCRKLPKPPVFNGKAMSQWSAILDRLRARDWAQGDAFFFIPYVDGGRWNVRELGRRDWDAQRAFQSVALDDGHRGFRDKGDRIWAWDRLHNDHWDVQNADKSRFTNGSRYLNVNPDGTLR